MMLVIVLHAVLCAATAVATPRLGPKAFLLAALGPIGGVALLAASAGDVLAGRVWLSSARWVPGLDLALRLRLDGLAWVMLVLVSGIGAAIFIFCAWYAHRDATLTRFVATLTAFAGAMVGLVLADDVLLLYIFWELTSVTSFLLVGLKTDDPASRRAALQALLITMLGGLAMLVGLLIVASSAGSSQLSVILNDPPPAGPVVQTGLALVLLGALTKSAQAPFHVWLPGAMAAPTPVSAYLHAAAMVKAGIYLLARFSPAFAAEVSWWRPLLVGVGVATMLVGGWRALRQHDLKRLLAFSTVGQLGMLTVAAGWGSPASQAATALLLLGHGMAKAALFCSLGALDHQAGTRDLRALTAMAHRMPVLAGASTTSAASMAGIPLLAGFIAKEELLAALYGGGPLSTAAAVGVGAGSVFTVAYSLRFVWGAFARKPQQPRSAKTPQMVDPATVQPPNLGMTVPVVVLAAGSLLFGVLPSLLDGLVGVTSGHPVHLALWHGFNVPLAISSTALVVGALAFRARDGLARVQDRLADAVPAAVDADVAYDRSLRALDRIAATVTGRTQVGSLPAYLGVIMTVAVALPGAALYIGHTPWRQPTWFDRGAHLPVVAVICVAAVLACLTGVRLTAVLLLGAVGYGMAMLYVLHGAPDLALTQLLVETLSVVVFLFVLRLLPTRFPRPVKRSWTGAKVAIATAVGVLATAMTLYGTSSTRSSTIGPAVSAPMLEQSYPAGHGRNVVNVILVDFRGLDTFGEATVVLVAALGIALLVLTARLPANELPQAPARAPSLLLRVAVRVAFYPILATGLFFLFAGHNNPGGGFIGGLVASLAFVLRYLSADVHRASAPLPPIVILGVGLTLSAGCALAPMLAGGQVLTSGYLKPTLPLLGDVSLTSVLIFDTGIFLVVVGLTLVLLDTLGSRRSTSLGVVDDEVLL